MASFGINTQVGNRDTTTLDNSETEVDFHLLEIHKPTATWIGCFLLIVAAIGAAIYFCRRKRRRHQQRQHLPLVRYVRNPLDRPLALPAPEPSAPPAEEPEVGLLGQILTPTAGGSRPPVRDTSKYRDYLPQ